MFNFNGGPGGGGSPNRGFYNPFSTRQGYGETRGWANPTLQGAISLPEKVMGLTCLLMACAIGGVVLGGRPGSTPRLGQAPLLWFIAMFGLVFATQALADRPGIGMVLFVAFGVVTGIVIAPLLSVLRANGDQYIVYEALAATAATTGGITLYARTTSRDFSRLGGWLFAALIGVVVAMVIGLFIQSTGLSDPHLGRRLRALLPLPALRHPAGDATGNAPGNAIRLALKIYLDIFNLFLNLLRS